MKTILLPILLASLGAAAFAADALDVKDNPFAPATPAPTIIYVPAAPVPVITPESFQASAMKWVGALAAILGAIVTVLLPAVAMLWTKLHDVVKRQDRQAENTGSLQAQVTSLAHDTPPPNVPKAPLIALLLAGALSLSACGSADTEFRRRVESAEVGGKAIVSPDGSTGIRAGVKIFFREPKSAIWRLR